MLTLVAACCRPPRDPGRVAAVRLAAGKLNEAELLDVARRHRVEGLVADGLGAAGVALAPRNAATLAERAASTRLQALRTAAEEVRVVAALKVAGIDAMVLKGASLAMLAYGTLGLKASWDADVFVAPGRETAAAAVLESSGYRLTSLGGSLTPVQFRRLHSGAKESVWQHTDRGTVVELHTRLCDLPGLLNGIGLGSQRMSVPVAQGAALQTLTPPNLLTYLCVHGAMHGWTRLKWLADVAALLPSDPKELAAWRAYAIAVGAGRCADLAILLSARLLGVPTPIQPPTDRTTLALADRCLWLLDRPGTGYPDGTLNHRLIDYLAIMSVQASVKPGWRAFLAAWWSQLGRPYHRDHLRVPTGALPAYLIFWLPGRLRSRRRRLRHRRSNLSIDALG